MNFCPVARHLRGGVDTSPPVVAKEAECRLDGRRAATAGSTPELFFCRDLDGYGWCVRKGDWVNVGIGRRSSVDFNAHVRDFMAFLEQSDTLSPATDLKWRGHAYLGVSADTRWSPTECCWLETRPDLPIRKAAKASGRPSNQAALPQKRSLP